MPLLSLVASHADQDLETIARLSDGHASLPARLIDDTDIHGVVSLATCNRFELYLDVDQDADLDAVRNAVIATVAADAPVGADTARAAFRMLTGRTVAEHLFAVVAGLDSAVIGEREIAGQARRALGSAQTHRHATGPLIRLFETAARTGKDVGASTTLGARGRSIVSVALDLAADIAAAPLAGGTALVIGTGAYAGATLASLRERGCTDIRVYSGSGRAAAFVAKRGGTAVDPKHLRDAIADADVIVGCSGSRRQVTAEQLGAALPDGHQVTVVDLALSRDFEPEVADLPGVELITLESVRMAAPSEATLPVLQAMDIVSRAAEDFHAKQAARDVDGAIVALRQHTMAVLETELERVRAQHGCTAAAEEVEFAMRRMVKSLLHVPTVRAKEMAARGEQDTYIEGLRAVYGIEPVTTARTAQRADTGTQEVPAVRPIELPAVLPQQATGTDGALPARRDRHPVPDAAAFDDGASCPFRP
ncbi:glutamyl-tRNA reductase [Tersicoccus solisilvae]|uniref:Glutamyl-tRNA reductase n=1 Tax=Tersicoccus solisilvae TaxID=1882339 RepID=A0ABQ1NZ29_9MICC|nr:glutamyl-tRNA reductase [Tersicoccus solisilvae]GGC88011.1 glutamyl-tRNA reductase [Tersicoccus solisilvae]